MEPLLNRIQNTWMASRQEFHFPLKHEGRLNSLHHRWENCINTILKVIEASPSSTECIAQWFEKLIALHSDAERHYHTLCHLEEMFGFVDLLLSEYETHFGRSDVITSAPNIIDFDAYRAVIELSVFFHDAIYNPKSGTNEEDSAKLFLQFVEDLFGNNHVVASDSLSKLTKEWSGFNTVKRFIIATKSHSLDDTNIKDEEIPFLQIFLDADMAVLGKTPQAYEYYASLIRKEYAHVPLDVYCDKRAEILQSFIGSVGDNLKTVYLNEHMREALEDRAITNLKREIAILRKGQIPGSQDNDVSQLEVTNNSKE
jgi:predicted metal-dependent HD superfamily phosphohydrolase